MSGYDLAKLIEDERIVIEKQQQHIAALEATISAVSAQSDKYVEQLKTTSDFLAKERADLAHAQRVANGATQLVEQLKARAEQAERERDEERVRLDSGCITLPITDNLVHTWTGQNLRAAVDAARKAQP